MNYAETNMLSRVQYEEIIRVFWVELHHVCQQPSESDLRALPKLAPEIDGCLAELRDVENDAANVLRMAFGYVDEFVHADWETVASAGYEAYKLCQSESHDGAESLDSE